MSHPRLMTAIDDEGIAVMVDKALILHGIQRLELMADTSKGTARGIIRIMDLNLENVMLSPTMKEDSPNASGEQGNDRRPIVNNESTADSGNDIEKQTKPKRSLSDGFFPLFCGGLIGTILGYIIVHLLTQGL